MPLATYVGTTEATEVVRQEEIDAFLAGANYPPPTAVAIAAAKQGRGNTPIRFPRMNQLSVPAGTLAETVDAVDVNVDTTENSITPARVAFAVPISRDLLMAQDADHFPGAVLEACIEAMWSRINSDLNGGSVSASNSISDISTPFTLAVLRATRVAWRALNVKAGAGLALLLSDDALGQLEESAETAGSPWALKPSDVQEFQNVHGFQGKFGSFMVFSDTEAADDSTGRSNWVTPIGDQSGIGVVMSESPQIVLWQGNDGLRRDVIYAHCRMRFGVGIVNQSRFLEILSS
jgi:hypothetical protein